MPYYDITELNMIKSNLAKIFNSLPPNANELNIKLSVSYNTIDTYKLIISIL